MRLIINGALGHMGQALVQALQQGNYPISLVAGIDVCKGDFPAPLYQKAEDCREAFDVLVDFSTPQGAMEALSLCLREGKAMVLATTGLDQEQLRQVQEAAKRIPLFYTRNMSLGVNLQLALAEKAAAILGDAYDVEIVETHHNLKYDAPSGTAFMLKEAVEQGRGQSLTPSYGRRESHKRREQQEIGIHSLRGGSIPGEHQLRFLGQQEELIITHRAYSKALFANGALKAALFLSDRPAGLYDMKAILKG